MRFRKFFVMLAIQCLLPGCKTLSSDEKRSLARANDDCGVTTIEHDVARFSFNPFVNGQAYGTYKAKIPPTNLGDFAVITSLVGQDICLLEKLGTVGDVNQSWIKEVGDAISTWPAYDSSKFESQVKSMKQARDQHLASLDKYPATKKAYVSFGLLDAAIPRKDYLNIRHAEIGFQVDNGTKLKGVDLGRFSGNVCVSSDQFSAATRTTLQETRNVVFGFALGRMSERDAIKQLVSSVYDSGMQRLLLAQEATAVKGLSAASCQL